MENKTLELTGSGTTVAGYVKWQVVNKDGTIDREGEHKNLILDAGLDKLATTSYANTFIYICVGEGNSTPIASQIGLDNETARSNAYLTSPTGACGTTYTSNIFTLQRTFNIPSGVLNGTYYELGFSWTATLGNNLWSRSLFKDINGDPTGVAVSSAQQLRVVYQLVITYGSATWQDGTVNITGIGNVPYKYRAYQPYHDANGPSLATPAVYQISALVTVNTTGDLMDNYWGGNTVYGEPNYTGVAFAVKYRDAVNYPNYTDWPALNQLTAPPVLDVPTKNNTRSNYISGSFYIDRTVVYDVNSANGSIQWICSNKNNSGDITGGCPDVYFFPTPIVKDNLHTLTLVFRQTWGRA